MPITPQGIQAWTDLFESSRKRSAERPYYQDIAQASRDEAVGRAGITGAEAQYAPQYFGGRAQEQEARGGLADVNLQYAPRLNEQKLMSGGLSNQLAQLGIQERTRALQNPPMQTDFGKIVEEKRMIDERYGADSPESQQFQAMVQQKYSGGAAGMSDPFAKAQQDRDRLVSQFGDDSEKVAQFDQYMQEKFKINPGILDPTGIALDPSTGSPLVNISSTKMGNSRYSGGVFMNPQTSEIIAFQTPTSKTRDLKTIAGAENVKSYVKSIKELAPVIYLKTTTGGKSQVQLAKLLNSTLGTNFDSPSAERELDANIKSFAEGFINQFGLNATDKNVQKAEDIIAPSFGESTENYLKRISRQLEDFAKIQQRAEARLAGGVSLGYLGGEQNKDKPVDKETMQIYLGRIDPRTVKQLEKIEGLGAPKSERKGGITVDLGTGEIR